MKHLPQLKIRDTYLIFLIALIPRLIAVIFTDSVNADAISRVMISLNWLDNPTFYTSGVWGPFHFYLISAVIKLFGDHIIAPLFINVILGSLTAVYVYKISDLLYDRKSALLAALIFCFIPNVFRQHLMVLAGTPLILFISVSLYFLIANFKENQETWKYGILAGIFYTLAGGFRFESWILMPVFAFIILLMKKWKTLLSFVSFGMIFPVFWLIGCYLDTGDFLYSIHGSADWNINVAGVNDNVSEETQYLRSYFLPIFLSLNISPILMAWMAWALYKKTKTGELLRAQAYWFLPFLYLLVIFQYKMFLGEINLHPRYVYTLIFLISPHFALLYPKNKKWPNAVIAGIVLLHFVFSFLFYRTSFEDIFRWHDKSYKAVSTLRHYIVGNQSAIPMMKDENTKILSEFCTNNLRPGDGLILDFETWDRSYYVLLNSKLKPADFFTIMIEELKDQYDVENLWQFAKKKTDGLLLIRSDSQFSQEHVSVENSGEIIIGDTLMLKVQKEFENGIYIVYRYHFQAE